MGRRWSDRGQAAVMFLLVVTALFAVSLAALAVLGGRVIDRTRAQSLADAAALGSVGVDRARAQLLTDVGGGTLRSWAGSADGAWAIVVVELGDAVAEARASVVPLASSDG